MSIDYEMIYQDGHVAKNDQETMLLMDGQFNYTICLQEVKILATSRANCSGMGECWMQDIAVDKKQ